MANKQDIKKVRSIRELFHGRFTDTEVAMLLEINNNNSQATVTYILEKEPKDVRMEYEKEKLAFEAVNRVKPHCSKRLLDKVKSGQINTEGDLYACRACDNVWWRLSPIRKKVSKCHKCGRRFDMVNPEKWWGWAEFHCEPGSGPGCGNVFNGWCHMQVASPCFNCGNHVKPTRIIPPKRTQRKGGPGITVNKHRCDECAPYFAMGTGVGTGPARVFDRRLNPRTCRCAHKQTRKALGLPLVIDASSPHDCSGSTVDTFLPQGDLLKNYVDFDDLESISEDKY